jgi:hypothetical protein
MGVPREALHNLFSLWKERNNEKESQTMSKSQCVFFQDNNPQVFPNPIFSRMFIVCFG